MTNNDSLSKGTTSETVPPCLPKPRCTHKIGSACHQPNGAGIPGAFPPLAALDYLNPDKTRAISVVLNSLSEPIQVNGVDYNRVMPLSRLTDSDVANVLTYVYSQWNNTGMRVSVAEGAAQR